MTQSYLDDKKKKSGKSSRDIPRRSVGNGKAHRRLISGVVCGQGGEREPSARHTHRFESGRGGTFSAVRGPALATVLLFASAYHAAGGMA